ncbi:MAG: single-stranded DNA-binding protein [Planctomycetes bacterium]|nr:single-stranded DNA-binding protein [Planctomycetota bacterium]
MANLNKVFLMGNLTRDPEIRYTQGGTAVTRLGIAVNRRYKDPGTDQWKDQVDFIDVVMFGRRAEVISEYFRKGNPIFVEGRLSFRTWDTPAGERRSKLEVVAENFEFIGGRGPGGGSDAGPGAGRAAPAGEAPASGGGTREADGSSEGGGSQQGSEKETSKEETPSYDDSGLSDSEVPF